MAARHLGEARAGRDVERTVEGVDLEDEAVRLPLRGTRAAVADPPEVIRPLTRGDREGRLWAPSGYSRARL